MKRSNGNFSHVSNDMGDFVFESVEGKGTIITNKLAWDSRTVVESYAIEVSDRKYEQLVAWSKEQEGKKYDYWGVIAHISSWFAKPRMGKWYCSELSFVMLAKIKGILGDDISMQKVSPHLFRVFLQMNPKAKRVR